MKLSGMLQAHEQRMNEKQSEKLLEQALQSQTSTKGKEVMQPKLVMDFKAMTIKVKVVTITEAEVSRIGIKRKIT